MAAYSSLPWLVGIMGGDKPHPYGVEPGSRTGISNNVVARFILAWGGDDERGQVPPLRCGTTGMTGRGSDGKKPLGIACEAFGVYAED